MPGLIAAQIATAVGAGVLGTALIEIGVGLAFSAILQEQIPDGPANAADQRRQLQFSTNLPFYRMVFGETRATVTILPHPVVGNFGYGVGLLNSDLSDGTPVLHLDGREIPLTGDPYDFEGGGAVPSSGELVDHLAVWIGLGDQTGPPDEYISGAPYNASTRPLGFRSTDAGAGLTVVYFRYRYGNDGQDSQRWPNVPPQPQITGLRTPVYDPREAGHDPDDPDTWAGSRTFSLNALHLLRRNPFRPYADKYLWLDLIADAADVDEEAVALDAGGTEPRHCFDGTVVFDGAELEQIMMPVMETGAAEIIQIGGRIAFAPGEASASVYTITDVIGPMQFSNMKAARSLPTQIKTHYVSPARDYSDAELALWDVPGAADDEEPKVIDQNLPFTSSATQAMRLREIRGRRSRQQRELRCTLPPSGFSLVRRSGVTCALGAPFDTRVDGEYEVADVNPFVSLLGEPGRVALALDVTLVGASAEDYAWSAEMEEVVTDPVYTPAVARVQDPGSVSSTVGNSVNRTTGDQVIPRVLYTFLPSSSAGVKYYEWEARRTAGGSWGEMNGRVPPTAIDDDDEIFIFVEGEADEPIDFQVFAVGADGSKSDPVQELNVAPTVSVTLEDPVISAPTETSPGVVEFDVTIQNDDLARSVEVYAGPDDDVGNASPLDDPQFAYANDVVSFEETGLGSGVTRYYFARILGPFGSFGNWITSDPVTTA